MKPTATIILDMFTVVIGIPHPPPPASCVSPARPSSRGQDQIKWSQKEQSGMMRTSALHKTEEYTQRRKPSSRSGDQQRYYGLYRSDITAFHMVVHLARVSPTTVTISQTRSHAVIVKPSLPAGEQRYCQLGLYSTLYSSEVERRRGTIAEHNPTQCAGGGRTPGSFRFGLPSSLHLIEAGGKERRLRLISNGMLCIFKSNKT